MIKNLRICFFLTRSGIFLFILFVAFSCTPKISLVKNQTQLSTLGVCLDFNPNIPADRYSNLQVELNEFIQLYNQEPHSFKLTGCDNPEVSTVTVQVADMKLVSPGKQVAGVLASAVGIIGVPFTLISLGSPYYFFFYYFPTNQTIATLKLTPDIANQQAPPANRVYTSSGFFGNEQQQIARHTRKFDKHLRTLFNEIENDYKRSQKAM